MNEIHVIFTANAGTILRIGGLCVWTDVLNRENEGGYGVLSEEAFSRLLTDPAFRPDAILFTHRHKDHYSEARLTKAIEVFPRARVFLGGNSRSMKSVKLSPDGTVMLHVFPLPHEGARYADVENDALLLEGPEGSILIPGDCPVGCSELFSALEAHEAQKKTGFKIGLALLNFPWLSLGKGRKAISAMDPGHVLFFHFPARTDDVYGYREQAERMLERFKGERDFRIAGEVFSEEVFLI